ncbi:MAG: efflux RND transporter periplasmic adaptor subunit [Hyphomicrobiales bacterium]|nr:efflux RND transporter periplasmic adaptor subunit [Hyphomicrobiales bacterium]MCP5370871.1 efflux RND transporter periplasmic adaptor subunit [Hyphomicrobiales bacterium]
MITKTLARTLLLAAALAAPALVPTPAAAADGGDFTVSLAETADLKAVFATVETADVTLARTRIGGTVTELLVDEGAQVEAGQLIARVVDAKLDLRTKAVNERIKSLVSQNNLARTALDRARKLRASGTLPQAKLDEAQTAMEVAQRELAAVRAEREVIDQQQREGAVYAPTGGRVLKVRVTAGAVVLAGEPVAELAARDYLLRLRLPERHARFLKTGDEIRTADSPPRVGRITQVYPELERGRVVADATLPGLGGFFVGERVSVLVPVGTRQAMVVPRDYLFTRFGVTFARLKDGTETVVQPGPATAAGVEILSGLRPGDVVVRPE